MCHRLNCKCTVTKPLDQYYSTCYDCGALIDLQFSAAPPTADIKKGFSPNAEVAARIKAIVLADWDEINELRGASIGLKTIIKTKGYTFSATTLGKHHRAIAAERGILPTSGKRQQYKNYGVVKRQYKQENIYFGSQA